MERGTNSPRGRGRGPRGGRSASRGGGRSGRSAPREDAAPAQEPKARHTSRIREAAPAPKKAGPNVEELAKGAADTGAPTAQRLASLQQLQRTLGTPAGQARALRSFDVVGEHLLGLLRDAEPTLCSAAVGAVSAWLGGAGGDAGPSTKPPAAPGLDPGSRLLEALLPALNAASAIWDGPSPVKPFQLRALLLAAKECMSKAPGLAAFRRAAAVFAVARRCVAAPSADGDCAAAALEALLQALKAHHLHTEDAGDLADALLGRARRGDLPASARPLLARTMHAVSSAWEGSTHGAAERQRRASQVADEVVQMLKTVVNGTGSGTGSSDDDTGALVAAALGLAACAAPLLVRGASRREPAAMDVMLRLLGCFADVAPHAALAPTPVQELCGYANLFITVLIKPPALPATPGSAPPALLLRPVREEEGPLRAALELTVLQEETGMAAALANLGIGGSGAAAERVGVKITLLRDEEAQPPRPASASAKMVPESGEKEDMKIHKASAEGGAQDTALISADAWAALAAGVRLCCAALGRPDVMGRPATLGAIAGDLLSWMTQLPREAGPLPPEVAAPLAALASPPSSTLSLLRSSTNQAVVQPVARLYVALLTRLPTALQAILEGVSDSLQGGGDGWASPELAFDVNVLLAAAKAGFVRGSTDDMDCERQIWVSMATGLLGAPELRGDRAAALAQKVLQLARLALDQMSDEEMKRQEAGRAVELARWMAVRAPALAAAMLRWQAQMVPLVRSSDLLLVIGAVREAQGRFNDPDQSLRSAALAVVAAAVGAWDHAPLLWDDKFLDPTDLLEAVLQLTDDADEKIPQQAQAIARGCALPAALAALARDGDRVPLTPVAALNEAVGPRHRSLTASQLKQILDFAAGAAPASVLAGGRQPRKEAAPPEDWVLQMFRDVEEAALTEGTAEIDPKSTAAATDLPAAWWALLQTAAKQCVAAKLTTHWGPASQTLAALEKAVIKLSEGVGAPAAGARRAGSCLLHFLFAVEQEMSAAIEGSVGRVPCIEAASLHFYGNRRACEGWLARLRPAAVAAAERLGLRHLAAYHSLRWLEALDRRVRARAEPAVEEKKEEAVPSAAPPSRPATPMLLLRRPESAAESDKSAETEDAVSPSPGAALLGGSQLQELKNVAEGGGGRSSARGAVAAAAALASALRSLHEGGEIQGVHAVLSRAFPQGSWRWLGAAALAADGRHESALAELSALETSSPADGFTSYAAALKAESYAAIQDWEGLQRWVSISSAAAALPAPEAAQFAYLAAWGTGQDVAWPPSSAETQQTPYMAALQSLAAASQRDLPSPARQGILDAAAARAVERMLGNARALVGELALAPQPPALEDLAAAAALHVAAQPDCGTEVLNFLLPKSLDRLINGVLAWGASGKPQWSGPAALEGAAALVAGAAAGGVPPGSKGFLDLHLALSKAAHASGNVQWATRLASAAQEGANSPEATARLDLRGAAALQALALGVTSKENATEVLELLNLADSEGQTSLAAAARVGLAGALLSPADLLSYDRDTVKDADLWWRYAQHLYSTLEGAEAAASAAAAGQALAACCKAVSLSMQANSVQDGGLGTLPVMLMALRIMTDHADAIHGQTIGPLSTHSPAVTVAQALESVPPPAWRPLLPRLISALETASSPALQAMAALTLNVARGDDPAAVLLPLLAEEIRGGTSPTPALADFLSRARLEEGVLCEDLMSFIGAVGQLALLEDERWAAVLAEAQSALTKRLAAAYAHLKTLRAPEEPFTAEFVAAAEEEVQGAVAPVLCALWAHVAATAATDPATPHQREFRERVHLVKRLEWMLEQLEAPLALTQGDGAPAAGTLEAALQRPLKAIKTVAAEVSKELKTKEVSLEAACPALAALRESSVPVPGLGADAPAVASVAPIATVLHTKTRPKKIKLLGTDGKRYTFLVKGREDLRVDAAVAAFLGAAASALGRNAAESVTPLLVVPVAPKAGLLGWVEGSTPLYSLYARYEAQQAQRAAWVAKAKATAASKAAESAKPTPAGPAAKAAAAAAQKALLLRGSKAPPQDKSAPALTKTEKRRVKKAEKEAAVAAAAATEEAAAAAAVAERPAAPADRFRALIKAAGVKTSAPRSSWPLNALKSVHLDLAAAAPRGMIASELLTASAGPAHWWARQRSYTSSTAAMSAFGYLLGLGDRHLENILLQSTTSTTISGGVIHVDFGVLFDRGQKLGVPEIVPFRLTQSMVAGLGPTGAAGAFKRRAEAALAAARSGPAAAPLAELLRFAVEDPLVDWTPESAIRAGWRAFERCAELVAFGRGGEGGAAAAAAAAAAACANLATELGPFSKMFGAAAEAVAAVEKHRETEQQSRLVLNVDLREESRLEATAAAAAATTSSLASTVTAAAAAAAPLEAEAAAQQAKIEAVLGAALAGRLVPALAAGPERWDPVAADVPLGMVRPFGPSGLTVVGAVLGMDPSTVPLGTTLLLKTATADDASREELGKRAAAIRAALDALHRYSAAVAAVNAADGAYLHQGVHARWLPALRAARDAMYPGPLPEGAAAADGEAAVATWRVLRVQSVAATALVNAMWGTQETLEVERVDLALAAADVKARAVEAAAAASPPALAAALARFAGSQAVAAQELRDAEHSADVLDSVQQLILGFATTVLATRDASGRNSGSMMAAVPWLTAAVQIADSLGSLAGELQLLVPACAALFASADAGALSASVKALAACIDAACDSAEEGEVDWAVLAESEAAGAMKCLLGLSSRWPAISGIIQCLQGLHATCGAGWNGASASPSALAAGNSLERVLKATATAALEPAAVESLTLGAAVYDALAALQDAWDDGSSASTGSLEGLEAAWQRLSRTAAGAVAVAVQARLLPTLEAALRSSAADFNGAASNMASDNEDRVNAPSAPSSKPSPEALPSFFGDSTADAAPALPEFFDFGDDGGDALGGGLDESDDFGALEGPMGLLSLEESGGCGGGAPSGGGDAGEETAELTPLLEACAESAGGLAAVDAVLHVTALTAQQGTQQAQRARADLAAHRWRHEAVLERALTVQELDIGPAPRPLGAAAPLLPSPAEAAAAALAVPREDILARLRDAIAGIDAAEANVAAWRHLEGPTQVQVCEELCRIAPRAAAAVRGCFQAAADWDAGASARARTVREAAAAMLDFEAARDESGVGSGEGVCGRYAAAVRRVQHALKAVSTAEEDAAEAMDQVQSLRRSRAEATEALRAAESAGAQAFVQLAKHALPLVKATQKVPNTVLELQQQFESLSSGAGELTAVQRRLQRLLAAQAPPGAASEGASEARSRVEVIYKALGGAKEALGQLPVALRTLHSAAAVAKRGLAGGGRGEAAARQQAGEVVVTLSDAMAAIGPLLDSARAAAEALSDVPTALEAVATSAAAELTSLCDAYGLNADAFKEGAGTSVLALPAPRCTAAPHLYPPPGGVAPSQQRIEFAESVLLGYGDKVHGRVAALQSEEGGTGEALGVEDHVAALVREATSVENLARMYEGWMPWV